MLSIHEKKFSEKFNGQLCCPRTPNCPSLHQCHWHYAIITVMINVSIIIIFIKVSVLLQTTLTNCQGTKPTPAQYRNIRKVDMEREKKLNSDVQNSQLQLSFQKNAPQCFVQPRKQPALNKDHAGAELMRADTRAPLTFSV